MTIILILVCLIALLWVVGHFVLSGPDHTKWETPLPRSINAGRDISPEHDNVVDFYTTRPGKPEGVSKTEWLKIRRAAMNAAADFVDMAGISVSPVDIDGVPGEWIVADGANPDRLVLFFTAGLSRSAAQKATAP